MTRFAQAVDALAAKRPTDVMGVGGATRAITEGTAWRPRLPRRVAGPLTASSALCMDAVRETASDHKDNH
jgi:hypothetical protein